MRKTVENYRSLPYHRRVNKVIDPEDGRAYFESSILELNGCFASASTRHESIANLDKAFDDYINALLKWGDKIPEPQPRRKKAALRRKLVLVEVDWKKLIEESISSPTHPMSENQINSTGTRTDYDSSLIDPSLVYA